MKTLTNFGRVLWIAFIVFLGLITYSENPDIAHVFEVMTIFLVFGELFKSLFKFGIIFTFFISILISAYPTIGMIYGWGMFGMMVISMFTDYLQRRNVKRQEKAMKRRRALTLEKLERRKQARNSEQTQYSNISTNDLINELNHRQQLSEAE